MAGIKIPIGTDNTGLNTGTSAAEKRLNKFKGMAIRTFAAIGAVSGVVAGFRAIAEQMDRIGKVSRGGIDVEFAQKLLRASELAGTSFESSLKAIRMFVKEIRSVDGPASKVSGTIEAMGLKLADLRKLDSKTLFTTIAGAIGSLDDETDQLAATTNLLGTRYGDLLPLIQEVATKGLPDMITATEDTITNIEQFNDSLTTAKQSLMVFFAPALAFVAKLLQSLTTIVDMAGQQIGAFGILLLSLREKMKDLQKGLFTFDRSEIRKNLDGAKAEFEAFMKDMENIRDRSKEGLADVWGEKTRQENTGNNTINMPGDSEDQDVIGDEGRKAIAAYNKIAAARKKAREERQREKDKQVNELRGRGEEIVRDYQSRNQRFNDPASITASSMRSIGGGGGVATPNEQRVLKVNQSQLSELKEIKQAIKALEQGGGTLTLK